MNLQNAGEKLKSVCAQEKFRRLFTNGSYFAITLAGQAEH